MERHELGGEIARLLKRQRRSQAWLAEQCLEVDRSTLHKWLEVDGNRISASKLQAICSHLGVENGALFELAIKVWPDFRLEYEPYLKTQKTHIQTPEIQQPQTIQLPYIPELISKDCPIYLELKLGKEVIERADPKERDKRIFEWPGWHERGEDWRKRFEEAPAHTLLNQWLNQPGIHAIVGEPGGGKSTLLRYWVNELTKKSTPTRQYVPLLIPLREVKEDGIKGFFEAQNKRFETQFDTSSYLVGERPKNVQVVWLFDGLDELPKTLRDAWVKRIKDRKNDCCIVTCRTALYDSDHRRAFGEPYYLMGLYPKDQKVFLNYLAKQWREGELSEREFARADEKWVNELHNELQTKDNVRRLAGSPLLLTLIARTNAPGRIGVPAKRVTFYQKAFKQLVKQREEQESVNVYNLQTALANLAFEISQNEIVAVFDENIFDKHCMTFSPQETLILKRSGILRFSDNQRCQWLHQTFQDWLLAEYLHTNGGLLKAVELYWRYAEYQEVLMMLWGLSSEQEQLTAAHYLIQQGCQPHLKNTNKRCSGLRAVLTLVNGSGVEVKGALFETLWQQINVTQIRREAVAIYPTTPQQLLLQLAKDDNSSVRRRVGSNPNTPAETVLQLAKDGDSFVRIGVVGNPKASAELLAYLAIYDDNGGTRMEASNDPRILTTETLAQYMKYLGMMSNYVARNPITSAETLSQLAKDSGRQIRSGVAGNPNTSVETLAELAKDDDWLIRRGVAGNYSTSTETLSQLAKDDDWNVRDVVAGNPNTLVETLSQLAKDNSLRVHWMVASNPTTSAETLSQLAENHDSHTRNGVAGNPSTSLETLVQLAEGGDSSIQSAIAGNPSASLEMLSQLVRSADSYIRSKVARNLTTSVEVLLQLVKDDDWNVRSSVASNPNSCLEWF